MTTQEKLQAVTQQIRKDIPRLMELSEGCLLEVDVPNEGLITYKSNGTFLWYGVTYISLVNTELCIHNKIRLGSDRYKIIGHEPMINDILEWFEKDRQLPEDTFFQDVFFQTNNGKYLEIYGDGGLLAKWDLAKLYLKDQNDELIDFLYNLMNKVL